MNKLRNYILGKLLRQVFRTIDCKIHYYTLSQNVVKEDTQRFIDYQKKINLLRDVKREIIEQYKINLKTQ
ncbi:MAG: hypothetical protein ACK4EX_02350 [Thermaurantimonas sp.]|uniref:Uncharacterized protein n=1 Tax=Thermaurantimonas aggregans TaxID=2173829 RepID=A0A401XI19_9FLAO|nr:hypothetical protein [Thermaurantimonas aggregans]GCD76665.1 hypothetical protein JCM31826_01470 [Thermaurantimonas aggregans]